MKLWLAITLNLFCWLVRGQFVTLTFPTNEYTVSWTVLECTSAWPVTNYLTNAGYVYPYVAYYFVPDQTEAWSYVTNTTNQTIILPATNQNDFYKVITEYSFPSNFLDPYCGIPMLPTQIQLLH